MRWENRLQFGLGLLAGCCSLILDVLYYFVVVAEFVHGVKLGIGWIDFGVVQGRFSCIDIGMRTFPTILKTQIKMHQTSSVWAFLILELPVDEAVVEDEPFLIFILHLNHEKYVY